MPKLAELFDVYTESMLNEWLVEMQQQQQKQHEAVVGMLGEMRELSTQQYGSTVQKLDYVASKLDNLQVTANQLTRSVAVANDALKAQEAKLVNLLESAEAAGETLTSLQASAASAAAHAAKDRKDKAKLAFKEAKLAFEDAEAAERKEAADQAMLLAMRIASERDRKAEKAAQAVQFAKVTTKLTAVEAHVSNVVTSVVSAAAAEVTIALKNDGEEIAEGIVCDVEAMLKLGARISSARDVKRGGGGNDENANPVNVDAKPKRKPLGDKADGSRVERTTRSSRTTAT